MANKISYLTDENGEKISPVVNINSIYTDDGKTLLDYLHPIGSIYISTTSTNPGTIFGGTWVAWGSGRVPVGVNSSNDNFNKVEKTGGEEAVSLTSDNNGRHAHYGVYSYNGINMGNAALVTGNDVQALIINNEGVGNIRSAQDGNGTPHNNLQPYITCYMWKRTQ